MRNWTSLLASIVVACSVCGASVEAAGQSKAIPFPVVFVRAADLQKLGLAVSGYYTDDAETVKNLPNRCYHYGEGSWLVSFSHEFLSRFKAKGFSRRSLCMALISGVRFDPESGQRLATYIMARGLEGTGLAYDNVSDEFPLEVPNCFRGGRPFTDCSWQYDAITGTKLNSAETKMIKAAGDQIDAFNAKLHAEEMATNPAGAASDCTKSPKGGAWREIVAATAEPDEEGLEGLLVGHGGEMNSPVVKPDDAHLTLPKGFRAVPTFSDCSKEFPDGYGYALNAYPSGGRDPSPEAVKLAADPRRRATQELVRMLMQRQQ